MSYDSKVSARDGPVTNERVHANQGVWMKNVEGRVAVVTGAASGMGFAMAAEFGGAGMKVVLADIEGNEADQATARLRDRGIEAISRATDVSDSDSVEELAAFTIDAFGRVDVICNNA